MTPVEVLTALRRMPQAKIEPPQPTWTEGPVRRAAAVLIPLVDRREDSMTVIFGQRSSTLVHHAGEVSFPGGRIEAGEDEATAALREAREEIGLDSARVKVLCRLDTQRAGSGYSIAPLVGLVTPPAALHPDGVEIVEAFEVPLGFLLDPGNHRRASMVWRGERRWYSLFEYGSRTIWGATATIVVNLVEVLRGER